jgi:hypothetical protein
MGFFTEKIQVVRMQGVARNCRIVAIRDYQSYYFFRKIIEKVGKRFGGVITKEVGGTSPFQECLATMEIDGKILNFYWAWHGIDLSADGADACVVLEDVAEYISNIRFNRFWLWFMK